MISRNFKLNPVLDFRPCSQRCMCSSLCKLKTPYHPNNTTLLTIMKSIKTKLSSCSPLIFSCMLAVLVLTGCGGPSREEVRSLGSLIEEFQAANVEGSRQLASGAAQLGYPFILEGYENQLSLIKSHRAQNQYEGQIKVHLDTMENGLSEGIMKYKAWIDAGYDGAGKPAPDEATVVNSFAVKLTEAETALAIIAGK